MEGPVPEQSPEVCRVRLSVIVAVFTASRYISVLGPPGQIATHLVAYNTEMPALTVPREAAGPHSLRRLQEGPSLSLLFTPGCVGASCQSLLCFHMASSPPVSPESLIRTLDIGFKAHPDDPG